MGEDEQRDEEEDGVSKVLEFIFRLPSKFVEEERDGGKGRESSAGHEPLSWEGLRPARPKVKREFLFESLLIFKPTRLKRPARPV